MTYTNEVWQLNNKTDAFKQQLVNTGDLVHIWSCEYRFRSLVSNGHWDTVLAVAIKYFIGTMFCLFAKN
jgi:hypothetical protein